MPVHERCGACFGCPPGVVKHGNCGRVNGRRGGPQLLCPAVVFCGAGTHSKQDSAQADSATLLGYDQPVHDQRLVSRIGHRDEAYGMGVVVSGDDSAHGGVHEGVPPGVSCGAQAAQEGSLLRC